MKIIKRLTQFIISLFLLVIIIWAVLIFLLQTKSGQEWAYNQIMAYIERKTQTQIQIEDVNFSFPSLTFEKMTISQNDHTLLKIQKFEISLAYSHLLNGRLIIPKLLISGLDVYELPQNRESASNSLQPMEFSTLPFYVKLEDIDIQHVRIHQSVLNTQPIHPHLLQMIHTTSFQLRGNIRNNPFRDYIGAHLLLSGKKKDDQSSLFTLGIDTQNKQLSLSLHMNEILLEPFQLNLPYPLKCNLALSAFAPLTTWESLFQQNSINRESLDGDFKLSLDLPEETQRDFSDFFGKQISIRSHFILTPQNELELTSLKIDQPNFLLEGSATVTSDLEIRQGIFKGEAVHLESLQKWLGHQIQGNCMFSGGINGSLNSLELLLSLDSPYFSIEEQVFRNIQSTIQSTHNENGGWMGSASLACEHQNFPLNIRSRFNFDPTKSTDLSDLQVDFISTHLDGKMSFDMINFICNGNLKGYANDLSVFSQWVNRRLRGQGQIEIQLSESKSFSHHGQQGGQILFQGQNLSLDEAQINQLSGILLFDTLNSTPDNVYFHSDFEANHFLWKEYKIAKFKVAAENEINIPQRLWQSLTAHWKIENIEGLEGKASLLAGEVKLKNHLKNWDGDIQLTIFNLDSESLHLKELTVSSHLQSESSQWPFTIKGTGDLKNNFDLAVDGYWHYEPQQEMFTLSAYHGNGHFASSPFQLMQPFHFQKYFNHFQLAGLRFRWGQGEFQLDFKQDPQYFYSQFKTNEVPSELFHFVAPDLPFKGRVALQGHFEGQLAHPTGQIEIDLRNIQFIEDFLTQKPLIAGKIFLDFNDRGVVLKSQLNGIGETPFRISGHLPLALEMNPPSFKVKENLPFNLFLNAEGKLDPFLQLINTDETNFSGEAKIAIEISGQMGSPEIRGHIDLINGSFESLQTGAVYHNIQAQLEGFGPKIILKQFSAEDSKNGRITATGSLSLEPKQHFPFEFQIKPSGLYVLDSDYAEIVASGSLHLTGNTEKSKLEGDLSIEQATLHLDQTLPSKYKSIDIHYINVPEGEKHHAYLEKRDASSPTELDIKVHASQPVNIEGNNIKSKWKGMINVTGSPANPLLFGDLRIAQGEYDLKGKIFNFTQGNIHFSGAPDKKTTLYVVASKEIDRIRADIIVKGLVSRPVISFRSNPPLSQREILSYILFNRGISDITPDEGDRLSQSFISLNSNDQNKSSDDFLSRLRNNIGIDRLDFTTNDSNNKDFGLQIGKHITEDILVTVNQSMTSISPTIAIEAKLHKNIKAQAEAGIGEDSPVRMSIKWKKDY